MALARLRTLVPPVHPLPPKVVECLGKEAEVKGVLFFAFVERQTTGWLVKRKALLLWMSYTSLIFSDPKSGGVLRLVPIKDVVGLLRHRDSNAVAVRVSGEQDALLYFNAASAAAPDQRKSADHTGGGSIERLIELLQLLRRIFSEPGAPPMVIEEYRDAAALRRVASVGKPHNSPKQSVEDKLRSLSAQVRSGSNSPKADAVKSQPEQATSTALPQIEGGMPLVDGADDDDFGIPQLSSPAPSARGAAAQQSPSAATARSGIAAPDVWAAKDPKTYNPLHSARWEFLVNKNIDEIECERRAAQLGLMELPPSAGSAPGGGAKVVPSSAKPTSTVDALHKKDSTAAILADIGESADEVSSSSSTTANSSVTLADEDGSDLDKVALDDVPVRERVSLGALGSSPAPTAPPKPVEVPSKKAPLRTISIDSALDVVPSRSSSDESLDSIIAAGLDAVKLVGHEEQPLSSEEREAL